jgi:predicted esterase YcpF (UPF0227 family)
VIVYLHGFNSSPQSHKAQLLERYLRELGLGAQYLCPALPPLAREAIAEAEQTMQPHRGASICFVGSSLGGFYATYLAERHGAKAVLLNPAIDPHVGLRAYLGPQRNPHTGASYELSEAHLREWRNFYTERITPQRYLLLVETGDEVLDYRNAVARYAGAEQVVTQGGDHSLQSFAEHLPRIVRFAGLLR